MVIALKSLPPGTRLNVVGFGTTIKPLFTSSKLSTDVSVTQYSHIKGAEKSVFLCDLGELLSPSVMLAEAYPGHVLLKQIFFQLCWTICSTLWTL